MAEMSVRIALALMAVTYFGALTTQFMGRLPLPALKTVSQIAKERFENDKRSGKFSDMGEATIR
jgi:hypothetical protein